MGYMIYDSTTKISFNDHVLAHLEAVIIAKLRRKESFALSWRESAENGAGRSTLWLDGAIPLRFRFDSDHAPKLDRSWLEKLSITAASSTGLIVFDENGGPAYGTTHEHGV